MKVKVRSSLDMDKPINLKRLGPKDKVVAGFISQFMQTDFYKRSKRKDEEKAYIEQTKKDETVKSYILAHLYGELSQNNTLSNYGSEECAEIIISVNQMYEDNLKRLLPNLFGLDKEPGKDFLAFEIERVEENHDLRKAFPDMPILLKASKKIL